MTKQQQKVTDDAKIFFEPIVGKNSDALKLIKKIPLHPIGKVRNNFMELRSNKDVSVFYCLFVKEDAIGEFNTVNPPSIGPILELVFSGRLAASEWSRPSRYEAQMPRTLCGL